MSAAATLTPAATLSTRELAEAAKHASRSIASLDAAVRYAALEAMAKAVEAAAAELLAANAEDLRAAGEFEDGERLSSATQARLTLNEAKLREMAEQIRSVAALPDPLGQTLDATELDEGLDLQKVSVPLGVLAVIFEARPDAVTQIAALALKSGNAAILKPGREVERTASVLVRVLRAALVQQGLPAEAVTLVVGRESVQELLGMHTLVDMVIPRGSKALVEYVQANTRIPVLGHAEGVCHIYVDRDVDEAMALRVIDDAKTDYAAACNAVETVLVHAAMAAEFLPKLAERLRSRGVKLHGDATVRQLLRGFEVEAVEDWHMEYGELALSMGVVESMEAAIEHIHAHGSSHTESILTEDHAAAERFLREVDAASVMHNASTRFADGFRYGFGAEVGISTSKFHARGPVGLEGLTTYKYVLRGSGQVAGEYRGRGRGPLRTSAWSDDRARRNHRTGLIGASVGLALKANGFAGSVAGWDANADELSTALRVGALDQKLSKKDVCDPAVADVLLLATPVLAILDWMQPLAEGLREGQLVTDVGSTKREIAAMAVKLFNQPGRARFLPGHPMAGKESGGAQVAEATLFSGATWLFTPVAEPSPVEAEWRELVEGFGATVRDMELERHDAVCAWVSHLPQMVATAMSAALEEEFGGNMGEIAGVGGRALREMTRLGASPYSMWRDVAMTNTGPVAATLLALEQRLQHMRENLRTPELREEFRAANRFRSRVRSCKLDGNEEEVR